MGESPRGSDPTSPPAAVTDRERLSDDERAVAADRAVRQVLATLETEVQPGGSAQESRR